MKNCLFAFTISLVAIACSSKPNSPNITASPSPSMQTAVVDTPPPTSGVDPDYQEDQSGQRPSDTIVGNTGYTRRQLDSIAKHKNVQIDYIGGKGTAKPHDPPKQK